MEASDLSAGTIAYDAPVLYRYYRYDNGYIFECINLDTAHAEEQIKVDPSKFQNMIGVDLAYWHAIRAYNMKRINGYIAANKHLYYTARVHMRQSLDRTMLDRLHALKKVIEDQLKRDGSLQQQIAWK